MIEQYYPGKFSPEARAAVEAELIRAGRAHDQRKKDWRSDFSFPYERSLQTYILSVFLVYAREAIELGKKGVWTVDQVRAQALEGLRLITIHIGSQRNYNFIEQSGSSIRRETQQEFEATSEWQVFEDELLSLADSKRGSSPNPFVIDASARPLGDNPFPSDHFNITELQQDLLRLLVSQDKSQGGKEFILTHDRISAAISYAAGPSLRVPYAHSDFQQLQSEKLIILYRVSERVWRGKPTQLGLTIIRNGTRPEKEDAPRFHPPEPLHVQTPIDSKQAQREAPRLNVDIITKWMEDEGYGNKELATALKIHMRTVSSMRNNGNYHGSDAVTKLANLMKRDVEDLYLP